jgi:membrane protease subunit HflC
MRKATIIIPIVVIALAALLSSIFIVEEREKALVLQFGQIKRVKEDPGIALKLPIIQNVARYDDRILSLDTDPIEVTPSDDRRLVVDAFARYRIADVVDFREAVGVGGIRDAERRLANILNAQVRAVLGSEGVTSNTILSEERTALMNRIRDEARSRAAALGLEVIDVRLKQTNLPEQNLEATFARMRAEREREAADEIARGEEAAQRVRALADRTVVELESEAGRESEIVRGEADARRNNIFAAAFGRDEEFFEFYRSLTAYQRALQEGNSSLIISPDSDFFDYLINPDGRGSSRPSNATGSDGGTAATGSPPEAPAEPEAEGDAETIPEEGADAGAAAPETPRTGAEAAAAALTVSPETGNASATD